MKLYWWELENQKTDIPKTNSDIEKLIQVINSLKQELAQEKAKNISNHSKRANELLKSIENLADDYDE